MIAIPINTTAIHSHIAAVSDELLKTGAVVGLSEAGSSTTENGSSSSGFDWPGKDPGLSIDFGVTIVSHDYGKTIGWRMMEGRDFNKNFARLIPFRQGSC